MADTGEPVKPTRIPHWRLIVDQGILTQEVIDHPYAGSGTEDDPYLVTWLPNDPRNPMTFPDSRKWFYTVTVAWATLAVSLVSSAYTGGVDQIMEQFNCGTEVATLGVSLFVVGFAIGPLLWAPMSELYGRQYLFIGSYCGLTVFNAACTGSKNIWSLIIFRFFAGSFGSSPLTNAGGVIADMFPASQRGIAMSVFAAAPFLGPVLGPIIGGFLGMKEGWKWVMGFLAIFSGALWIAGAVCVPETYAPVLLQRRAAKLSKVTGKVYQSKIEVDQGKKTPKEAFKIALSRPWILLFREPIVLLLSIYMAIIYGTLYMMFAAFPIVYQGQRGWNQGVSGLAFLGIMVGMLLAVAYTLWDNKRYINTQARHNGFAPPEARLPPCLIASIVIPIGLFWFAWTNYPSIHFMASIAAGAPFGFGMVLVFLSLMNYLIDAYTIFAASVLAANSVLRSIFGAVFPLFTTYMYNDLGVHWASSIPAFLALACVPFPFLFYKYGPAIRTRCKYAAQSDAFMKKLMEQTRDVPDETDTEKKSENNATEGLKEVDDTVSEPTPASSQLDDLPSASKYDRRKSIASQASRRSEGITMGVRRGKRQVDQIDLTQSDDENPQSTPKTPRVTRGQRLGEDTLFAPLGQSSQLAADDEEDDAQAADVIPGSQAADDPAAGSSMLYGNVNTKIVGDRLPLSEFKQREREERKQQKEREKARKEAEKRARALAKGKGQQWEAANNSMFSNLYAGDGSIEGGESLEELIGQSSTFNPRDIGQVAENFGLSEADLAKMPMADRPAALSTELLPYQRQGLAWMIEKENPTLPAAGSEDVVQLWKRKDNRFTNIATNFSTSIAPPLASGGILADDMGLGKTIQIISLILANSAPKTPGSSKTTLIVAPVGVMSNWKNQIQDHTHSESAPQVHVYHGTGKKEAANLDQYDVVVTSYGALALEYNPNAKVPPKKGIFSVHWRRVVLDEGHTIRNPRSKGALAACNLRADSRWTLTGTPIVNSLKDLYSQVRFLKLSGGLEDMTVFTSVLIRPLMSEDPNARLLLQALMSTICLRRRKDMEFVNLRLPPLTSRVLRIKFHTHEQEKYDMFQSEARGMLLDFKSKDKSSTTYSHLLEVILRLRQVCNHWALCKDRIEKLAQLLEDNKVVPLTPENIKALQDMLRIQIESQETCPICLDTLEQPVITACAHTFCKGCIEQVIERQHKCPMCRAEITDTSTLVEPAVEMGESTETVVADPDTPSSKIEALIKILTAQGQAPGTKTVVFSQWTSFLNLLEPHLNRYGVGFARVDGKMSSLARDNSTYRFSHDPNCKVLLASLSVCSVGLNLVAANQAILADSWWAPAIEDQAVDRVYRLGQTRETTVWRLVMEDSIEDRVLAIQETKRKLMLAAFRETAKKKKVDDRATRVADLEKLLT
ncbi:SNF2 family helicase [Aspergillus flavus AF70]|nr:SNF2 family helicase [Aspergillus flavus AF70]